MISASAKVSIVVPTKDRHEYLDRCLRTIVEQTALPAEVLVVSASQNARLDKNLCEKYSARSTGISFIEIDSPPGSALQRNVGIRMASGDVICFLDDDVTIAPTYLAELSAIYAGDTACRIGGVQGVIVEPVAAELKWYSSLSKLFAIMFMQARTAECQKVLISGKYIGYPARPDHLSAESLAREYSDAIQWMSGGCMSVRREVLEKEGIAFDEMYETFGPFAHMEDGDFSHALYKSGYKLVRTGRAICYHHAAGGSRRAVAAYYAAKAFNHFLFWRKNIVLAPLSSLAHLLSQTGLFIEACVKAIISQELSPVTGVAMGWRKSLSLMTDK